MLGGAFQIRKSFAKFRHLGLVLFLGLSLTSAFASDPCRELVIQTARGDVIWNSVTGRPRADYQEIFDQVAQNPAVARQRIPTISEADIIAGRASVLSLGEGNAGFALDLLQARRALLGETTPITNIHAVDQAYQSPDRALLPRVFDAVTGAFRDNYHASLFQDLNLRDGGNRREFDHVVSSNALAYIVSEAPAAQAKATLLRALEHLKPGGSLVMWGHFLERGDMDPHGVLRELTLSGHVSSSVTNFSGDFLKPSYIVIRKPLSN